MVTGGQGFIGAWVVKQLLDEGAHPIIFDLKENNGILEQVGVRVRVRACACTVVCLWRLLTLIVFFWVFFFPFGFVFAFLMGLTGASTGANAQA